MNRCVLITGASSGIGRATALRLAGEWRLALVGRRLEALGEVVQAVASRGGEAIGIGADLAAHGTAEQMVARAVERFGGLDALVNNAGVFEQRAIGSLDAEHVERLLRTNLLGPMLLARAALPHLHGRRGGCIVNVGSVAADQPFTGCGAYAASKAGLAQWSRVLREELRGSNVRVALVVPGATDTAIWPEGAPVDRSRMCRPEDVAEAIRFALAAPASASLDRIEVTPPGGAL